MRRITILLVMALLLAACGGGGGSATAVPGGGDSSAAQVLAWNPNSNQLAWYGKTGQPVKLAEGKATQIFNCGLNPAGDKFVVYQGDSTAKLSLYPLAGGSATPLEDTSALACSLQDRVQFSPDGNRLGMLKYGAESHRGEFPTGSLRLLKMPEGTAQAAISDVTSFDLQNDGALVLQLYANSQGQANSADLRWWDGSKERVVQTEMKPQADCSFQAGWALRGGDKVYALLGEKCKPKGSTWRLIQADFAGGNVKNVAQGPTGSNGGAGHFTNTGTTDMWLLPGGASLLIAYPNGLSNEVSDLVRVAVADGKVTPVLARVVMESFPAAVVPPRRLARSGATNRLALIVRDGNGGESLYTYDLSKPDTEPAKVAGGSRNDRLGGVAWTADGQRLFYLITGDSNGLYYVSVSGENKLVVRGTFQGLAINPSGSLAATVEPNKVSASETRYNLVQISIADQSKATLVEGAKDEKPLTPLLARG